MSEPLDFQKLKRNAHGMLSPSVYKYIYETVCNAPDGDIVEVGTAHGASSIVMALGIKKAGRKGHVYTIDKIEGGSRDRYGDLETNKQIIHGNFNDYNLSNNITLHIGTSDEIAPILPKDFSIAVLMLDADGAIDRDLALFYNLLVPGGVIIIDDCNPDIYINRKKIGVFIDQKHKLTYKLVSYFEGQGLFKKTTLMNDTYFAIKPISQTENIDFSKFDVLPIYRSLIFAEGKLHNPVAEAIGHITQRFPVVHDCLKALYFCLINLGKERRKQSH